MMVFARYILLLLLAAGSSFPADAPAKPACIADTAGRFWPDEANDNPKFAAALRPYGYPEICTLENGVYVWKSPTVSLDQLRKAASKKRPIPERAAKP
jgi:hypothetical protein